MREHNRATLRTIVAGSLAGAAAGAVVMLSAGPGVAGCTQETSTTGRVVTYAAGMPGCRPVALPYGDHAQPAGGRVSVPLVPCATEDSVSCVWDAAAQGNGRGRSYVTDADGRQTFTDTPADAGWVPLGRVVDGHRGCLVLVGPTSLLRCPDGFETTS